MCQVGDFELALKIMDCFTILKTIDFSNIFARAYRLLLNRYSLPLHGNNEAAQLQRDPTLDDA